MATASLADPGKTERVPTGLVAVAIAALPLLHPQGIGHFTLCDIFMGAAIVAFILWAGSNRSDIHVPYVVPMAILALTGMLAALFGIDPGSGFLSVVQETFLLLWAATIANLSRNPDNLDVILGAWAWTATAWATVLIGAVVTHQWWLAGVDSATGARGQLTFDNPNQAGIYFLISLFVVLLGRHPKGLAARGFAITLLLGALVVTGSNAALLSLVIGGAAGALFAVWRKADIVVTVGVGALTAAFVVGAVYLSIQQGLFQRIESSSNVFVERSLARGPSSATGRETLFSEELNLYWNGSLLGRGPATTKSTLAASFGQIVKEAHDDYLATLIERGPLGVVGLIILIGCILVRAFSVAAGELSRDFVRVIARPWVIVAVVVASLATALTHEILHYRHVWALLGVIAGLHLAQRKKIEAATSP